jgi:hypothetical protein
MIGAVIKQLVGLFVDDEFLAAALLCIVAIVGALTLFDAAPSWVVGALLALAVPIVLAASVARSAWRDRRNG